MNQILYNPREEAVEFMHNRQVYIFQPGEKRVVDKVVADHAIRFAKTGFKIYDGSTEPEAKTAGEIEYEKMPWRKMVSIGSAKGIFKPSMNRETLYKLLREEDAR